MKKIVKRSTALIVLILLSSCFLVGCRSFEEYIYMIMMYFSAPPTCYLSITSGRYVYLGTSSNDLYVTEKDIYNTYDDYYGVLDITEITKQEFISSNGLNVISSSTVLAIDEGYKGGTHQVVASQYTTQKEGTYYYRITGYIADTNANRTELSFFNLKEKGDQNGRITYYVDKNGNTIRTSFSHIDIQYTIANEEKYFQYSLEGAPKEGVYENTTIFTRITEEEFLNKNGINVLALPNSNGETNYFNIETGLLDCVFEDLKEEYKEGRSKYRYVDKNNNEIIVHENNVLYKLQNRYIICYFEHALSTSEE